MADVNWNCGNCFFFEEGLQPDSGKCHRYAPRPSASNANWAEVAEGDWCGDLMPKNQAAADSLEDRVMFDVKLRGGMLKA